MLSVNSVSNISFESRYVGEVKIFKQNEPYYASLVSFDLKDRNDILKINEICNDDKFKSFGWQLYTGLSRNDDDTVKNKYCLALTKNTENDYSNINKDNVLGIYSVYEHFSYERPLTIAYFMTQKDFRHDLNSNSEFKEIGRGMFNSIRKIFPEKSLYGLSAIDAVNFWKKMGFKQLADRIMLYKV